MSSPSVPALENRPRVVAIVVAGFIGFLVGQVVATLLEALGAALTSYPGGLSALTKVANPPWWANALGLLGVWTGFGAAIVFAYREGHLRPWPDQWRPRASDAIYVVLGVACQYLIDAAYYPFHFKSLNRPVNHLFAASHGGGFILVGLMTVFLAPLFEEWFFRGVLFRALAEGTQGVTRRSAVVIGVVVSAALFGLAHGEPLEFAGLFALGIVLAIVAYRTKRLVPSYLTHAAFNATAFVMVIHLRSGH
ncbi:MAG TPA: type II CAAX endopeptidase family protein [Acidimicrobiales bacterium]|nr:type II CAAX endopeptidase family protein [Acidimicrobiales bacterium]